MGKRRWVVPYGGGIEIACDESGAEGEKLADGETRLFTHASVAVPIADASACVRELRVRIGSPAQEYKANHLLRPKHRRVLEWFLGPDGPITDRARVVLVDKERFLLSTFRALLADPTMPGWLAVPGPADGPPLVPAAVNDLLRGRVGADEFLLRSPPWLSMHSDAVRSISVRQARRSVARIVVDPLFWAIVRAVDLCGAPVDVVHDRHLSLTPRRIESLVAACAVPVRFSLTAARLDARVQLADFLAGIVRRTRTAALLGRGDPVLLDLVEPYLAPTASMRRR